MGNVSNIGDFRLFAKLSEGAATTVYKGYQHSLQRFVLLKVLEASYHHDEDFVEWLAAEARLIAKIQHPNVVAVYTYGHDADHTYLATEFVEGRDAAAVLASGRLPVELALYVLREVAHGLQAAHAVGVLHRDLKPSNILLAHQGQVKLTDFGLASLVEPQRRTGADPAASTVSTPIQGTMAYLAPELVLGAPPTPASDLFALGATLFELLTGYRAFTGATSADLFDAVLHDDPLPVLQCEVDLSDDVVAVCRRLLAKEPAQRYETCAGLLADLDALDSPPLSGSVGADALRRFLSDPAAYTPAVAAPAPSLREEKEAVAPAHQQPDPPRRAGARIARYARYGVALMLLLTLLGYTGYRALQSEPDTPEETLAEQSPEASSEGSSSEAPPVAPGRTAEADAADGEEAGEARGDIAAERIPTENNVVLASDGIQSADGSSVALDSTDPLTDTIADAMEPPSDSAAVEPVVLAPARVRLIVGPWAMVHVNGVTVGRSPISEALELSAGVHTLRLEHPAFPPYQTEIQLAPAQDTTLQVSLWDHIGQLTVEVSPWAHVTIDSVYRDTTPHEAPFLLAPGSHTLMLEHPTLGRWSTRLEIDAGEKQTLQYNLQEVLGAQRDP